MEFAEQFLSHHLASTLLVNDSDQELMERRSFTDAILPQLRELPEYCSFYAFAVLYECSRRNIALPVC
jgi:hypothetical protein